MSKKDKKEKTYFDTGPLLKKDHESLLLKLKEQAINVAIDERAEFEKSLLQLAQEIKDENKRNAVYEVLVSLQILWNRYKPEKGLHEKFRTAFDGGNYQEAGAIYKRLAKQGIDYIGTYQIGEGYLIPLATGEKDIQMQYNKKELTFYNLEFEQLAKVLVPGHMKIIDVVTPFTDQSMEEKNTVEIKKKDRELWILMEDEKGKKVIVSINIKSIDSIEMIPRRLEMGAIYLSQKLGIVTRLAYFHNHLLLVSDKAIYYLKEDKKWQEFYFTRGEITAFETTKEGFWIGHKNGNVLMLKDLYHVGNRVVLPGFTGHIKNIRKTGRHVLVWSKTRLLVSDHGCKPVSKPIETQCEIRQAAILGENLLLLLTANGMLTARDMDQGNIRWQINLGDLYEILFFNRQYLYCGKKEGEAILFEIPTFHTMTKDLESQNIYVEKQSLELDPNAPTSYFSEFTGRRQLLQEIKEKSNVHFLIHGEPRFGKTSLLNVLPEVLAEKAKCCIIETSQLLKDSDSYEAFEKKFMKTCMEQNFLKLPLPEKEGCNYQKLRSMVKGIKGDKNFCVFCLDNFYIPEHFDKRSRENFITFMRSLLQHPDIRFIITCSQSYKKNIEKCFGDFKDVFKKRKLLRREIPLFSEGEVKNTIRKKISPRQSIVDKVYLYIGGFPHLLRLYDRWQPDNRSIEEHSQEIAKSFSENIFEYFRDLSLDARLLIATCLYENLAGEKNSYTTFYDRLPFLKKGLPKNQLDEAIVEINGYSSGLSAYKEAGAFKISISDNARLFFEAARHIPLIKDFKALYEFTSAPDQEKAHQVADTFTRITQSGLDPRESLKKQTDKHKDKFYVNKLTIQGLKALKMPLTTFIVIPLKPWQKEEHEEVFHGLYIDFQEFNRKSGEAPIFYTLIFDLYGVDRGKIKEDIEGLDRISIIDAVMMKNIIMAESPQGKASRYIFEQLSIRERSPYTTSGAVPDSLFFGREMEIALIRGLPENIGVFGTRTIGKTSLLRKLHKAFQSHKQWKVYDMDCGRIETEEALLKNLAEKMGISFKAIPDMDRFRRYVTREAEKKGHRYLFLLDEVDRLVEYDMHHDEKIFNTFNRLCNETLKNNESAARFILFGFQQMFEQMKNPLSRLYNFMVFLPLQALDMEGAMALVTRPIENILVRWKNKEDAAYLVDSCSRHPRLLQAACHALLNNLDKKKIERNIITRPDVDMALNSQGFRDICMRLYRDPDERRTVNKIMTLFARLRGKNVKKGMRNEHTPVPNKGKEFLSDLHRITILAAVRLFFEEKKEVFTIVDIQEELKKNGIDVSPNIMRNILDRLCLSGNFRLREESTIIAKKGTKVLDETEKINISDTGATKSHLAVTVDHPDVYGEKDKTIHRFTFEFGVKVFPQLLVAHFGGLKQCERERQKLTEKGAWKKWLGRY